MTVNRAMSPSGLCWIINKIVIWYIELYHSRIKVLQIAHAQLLALERKSERLEKILKTQNPCLRPGIRPRSILHLGCNWSGQLSPYGSPHPPETNDVCMNTKTAYYFMYYDYEGYSKTFTENWDSNSHLLELSWPI